MSVQRTLRRFLRNTPALIRANARKTVDVSFSADIRGSILSDYVRIGKHSRLLGSRVGRHSYCGDNCQLPRVDIGPFCSIASNVMLAAGNHPLNLVSSSPSLYKPEGIMGERLVPSRIFTEEFDYVDKDERFFAQVGADCWIATGAVLVARKGGLKIGVGSVVAAGSVVTHDPPLFHRRRKSGTGYRIPLRGGYYRAAALVQMVGGKRSLANGVLGIAYQSFGFSRLHTAWK